PSIYHLTSYPSYYSLFFFTATPPTNIYTLSLHDALPISFNILSNQDTNNDQSNQTDRPSVLPGGGLCVPGTTGCTPLITNGVFSDRKSTRLNSSHVAISYAVFCLKKKKDPLQP